MIQIDMPMPEKCGYCPCFHYENPIYCQAVEADKNKKIVAPYWSPRPEWCPLKEHEAEKPIAKEDDTYECCICGAIVGQDELDASGIVQERFNYCQNCGKAVKWE